MTYTLGIDLGTTGTAAAVVRDGRSEVVDLGSRGAVVPSVVFATEDNEVLVGDAAVRRGTIEPERMAREFKRRIGDPTPILLGGTPWAPEALLARLLRWTVDHVTEREGGPPARIALSHPANWGSYKLDLLAHAASLAEVQIDCYLSEPEAAAASYVSTERVASGSVVAVYDLGGGTFDAAVLRKTDTGFDTLGEPEGLEHLGGADFDQALIAHVANSLVGATESLVATDPGSLTILGRLRQECIEAKEALSSDSDVAVPVVLRDLQTEVRVTRAEFEAMIRPALVDTVDALRRAVRSADLSPTDVSAVLLVGGSSRIPLVAELVATEFGRPVAVDAHPLHAIALGAALAAEVPAASLAPVVSLPQPDATAETEGPTAELPAASKAVMGSVSGLAPSRRRTIASLVAVALVLSLGSVFARANAGSDTSELVLEPAASNGAHPFTPSVAKISSPGAAAIPLDPAPSGPRLVSHRTVGTTPGLYGGSGDQAICDPAALIEFLQANPAKAQAWVAALNRDSTLLWSGGTKLQASDIPSYVSELAPVVLRADTRVTNHGFHKGRATPHQSVLEAGTAVLVDAKGTPRTRCACGNPLTRPQRLSRPVVRGVKWPDYRPARLIEIVPAPAPVVSIVVIDVSTGADLEIVFPKPEPKPNPIPPTCVATPDASPSDQNPPAEPPQNPPSDVPVVTPPPLVTPPSVVPLPPSVTPPPSDAAPPAPDAAPPAPDAAPPAPDAAPPAPDAGQVPCPIPPDGTTPPGPGDAPTNPPGGGNGSPPGQPPVVSPPPVSPPSDPGDYCSQPGHDPWVCTGLNNPDYNSPVYPSQAPPPDNGGSRQAPPPAESPRREYTPPPQQAFQPPSQGTQPPQQVSPSPAPSADDPPSQSPPPQSPPKGSGDNLQPPPETSSPPPQQQPQPPKAICTNCPN